MAGHVFRQRCWMTLAQVRPFVLGKPRRIGVTVSLLHHSGMWKCLTIQKGNTVREAIIRTLHNPAAKEPSEKGSSSSSPHVSGASTSCKHCSLFVTKSGDQKEFATYLYLEFGSNTAPSHGVLSSLVPFQRRPSLESTCLPHKPVGSDHSPGCRFGVRYICRFGRIFVGVPATWQHSHETSVNVRRQKVDLHEGQKKQLMTINESIPIIFFAGASDGFARTYSSESC